MIIPASVKLFVFDLDGTFYPQKKIKSLLITKFLFSLRTLSRYQKARHKMVGLKFKNFEELIEKTSVEMGQSNSNWIKNKFYPNFYQAYSKLPKNDKVNPSLSLLKEKGYKIAVVSDYGQVESRLIDLNIDGSRIDYFLGTEEEGILKPHVDIAHKIEQKFNLSSKEIVYLGDRLDTDAQLAKNANSHFIGISFEENLTPPFLNWQQLFDQISAL